MNHAHLKVGLTGTGEPGIVIEKVKSVKKSTATSASSFAAFESLVEHGHVRNGPDKLVKLNFIVKTDQDVRFAANWVSVDL